MKGIIAVCCTVLLCTVACAQPQAEPASGAPETVASSAPPPGPPQPMDFGPVVRGSAAEHDYSEEQVERGAFLVEFGSCNDCHTPWNRDPVTGAPYPDMERMLSGHPRNAPDPYGRVDPRDTGVIGPSFTSFAMPFGITYALNLTPDIETGTGSWTEEMFLKIFREARHMGGDGRTVLPPMPWFSVASLPDEDIIAIFAYLRSIPPVRNAVPSAKVPQEVIDAIGQGNAVLAEQIRARHQQP